MSWEEILKEKKYPCDFCDEITDDVITVREGRSEAQVCKKCRERAESEEESEYEYDEMDPY